MTPEIVIEVGQQALRITALLSAPILGSALLIGLLVAMFQAATQINEMTLTFIPKLLVIAVVLLITGPWMLHLLVDYTEALIENIPYLIG